MHYTINTKELLDALHQSKISDLQKDVFLSHIKQIGANTTNKNVRNFMEQILEEVE